MFAVVFEVLPSESGYQRYLDLAAALRPKLDAIDGFLSIERFASMSDPGWILSLSCWRDEAALVAWRRDGEHHAAQSQGRQGIFSDYRLRVLRIPGDDDADVGREQTQLGLWEYPDASLAGCKRLRSLSNPDKQIALIDFTNAASARAWREETAREAVSPSRVLCGTIIRDYGMFDREQAPQRFPAIGHGKE
ncbi:antibiotic biosynthesis monooxygenase [Herbaspirillum sp. ST 5-3]|uniref:antibiotic biosynthesis monooxygenase family protein n=1 Tax=Oxalobacteraceae TaxID=75682 RepID=UPI0010A4BC09|nr:antibiotic biosynthesis monooxygenase [Herbaspirillum sp. ST 5-3]